MPLKISQMTLKGLPIFLVFLLISLASCKSYGSKVNSSLKSQAFHRYSKQEGITFSWNQTRDQCATLSDLCSDDKDCCNGPDSADSFPLGCYKPTGSATGTCEECGVESASCSNPDQICCAGYRCNEQKQCVANSVCTDHEKACLPQPEIYPCCELEKYYMCIVDEDGKSYCSNKCSHKGGQCNTIGGAACCDGFYCDVDNFCACDEVGSFCSQNSNTCCDASECDSSTSECTSCLAPLATCTQADRCCSSVPCDTASSKCCLAADASCTKGNVKTPCCPGTLCDGTKCVSCLGQPCTSGDSCEGYECDSNTGKFVLPCVNPGTPCTSGGTPCCSPFTCDGTNCVCQNTPCKSDTSCCNGYECKNGKCKEKKGCSVGVKCSDEKPCCSDLICDPIKIICLSSLCQLLGAVC